MTNKPSTVAATQTTCPPCPSAVASRTSGKYRNLAECVDDVKDLTAAWEQERAKIFAHEKQMEAQLAENNRLRLENEALIRNLNSSLMKDEDIIKEDIAEIKRLKEIIAAKDVENNRLNLEKNTSDESIRKLNAENANLKEKLKNSVDASIFESEKLLFQIEHNAKINCETEKANQKTQIDHLNNRITQADAMKSELDQCKQDRESNKSKLSQKDTDFKLIEETLRKCNADKSECGTKNDDCKKGETALLNEKKQWESDRTNLQSQIVNLQNDKQQISNECNKIQSNCSTTVSSLQFSLEQERIALTSIQIQLATCNTDKTLCGSNLQNKLTDFKSTEDKLKTCQTDMTNCNRDVSQRNTDLQKCNDDKLACSAKDEDCKKREAVAINEKKQLETAKSNLENEKQQIINSIQSNCSTSISSLQLSLEQERMALTSIQIQLTACKTDDSACRSNLLKKEADCKNTDIELNGKITACENTKKVCEASTAKKDEDVAKCKAESAVMSESAKNGIICEVDKSKVKVELSDCQSYTQVLIKAIAGKLKMEKQIEHIISSNKDTDLSMLTVTTSVSDTRQQTIARQILDAKSTWNLKTTCSP